jgi:uncharacterized protein YdcH (DUF465 family)
MSGVAAVSASVGKAEAEDRRVSPAGSGGWGEVTPPAVRRTKSGNGDQVTEVPLLNRKIVYRVATEKDYFSKAQLRAINNSEKDAEIFHFISENFGNWARDGFFTKERLQDISSDKLQILFGTTLARKFIAENAEFVLQNLTQKWSQIRDFINKINDFKSAGMISVAEDMLVLFNRGFLSLNLMNKLSEDELVPVLRNLKIFLDCDDRDPIETGEGEFLAFLVKDFSPEALKLLFSEDYFATFQKCFDQKNTLDYIVAQATHDFEDSAEQSVEEIKFKPLLMMIKENEKALYLFEQKILPFEILWSLHYGQDMDYIGRIHDHVKALHIDKSKRRDYQTMRKKLRTLSVDQIKEIYAQEANRKAFLASPDLFGSLKGRANSGTFKSMMNLYAEVPALEEIDMAASEQNTSPAVVQATTDAKAKEVMAILQAALKAKPVLNTSLDKTRSYINLAQLVAIAQIEGAGEREVLFTKLVQLINYLDDKKSINTYTPEELIALLQNPGFQQMVDKPVDDKAMRQADKAKFEQRMATAKAGGKFIVTMTKLFMGAADSDSDSD